MLIFAVGANVVRENANFFLFHRSLQNGVLKVGEDQRREKSENVEAHVSILKRSLDFVERLLFDFV